MDNIVRRQNIRDRIADGRLPNDKIGRVSATYGIGEVCDACSLGVSTEQVLYRLGRLGVRELIFHNACFAMWKLERDRMYPSRAAAGVRAPHGVTVGKSYLRPLAGGEEM
jgi:hypothetical protein